MVRKFFFRHEKVIKKRRFFSIAHQSLDSVTADDLIKDERGISTPKTLTNKIFVYKKDDMQVTFSCENKNNVCLLEKPVIEEITAYTENSNLYIEKNGKQTILNSCR